ncbi:MAG: CsbD family protein [Propionibacteriaceae bacterium]|nr:CsbD family protein [Propionibacteriaceae bacterium]
MAFKDRAENAADDLTGKAKEAVGDLAGDDSLRVDGKTDQAAANLKQSGERAKNTAADLTAKAINGGGVVHRLHKVGVRSEYAYVGAFASIGFSLISWLVSRNKTGDDKAQSDRWGIFIGHWAPTFMALGVALKFEEE